jgi:hypothetical protein
MNTHTFLTHSYPLPQLKDLLISQTDWHPYPPASNREAWASVAVEQRQDILTLGQEALETPWPNLPATLYLRFARDGDRAAFEAPYFLRRRLLAHLVLAECVEGQGRFLDPIADAVWSISEESSWCLPTHITAQKAGSGLPDTAEPIVDLFAAETSALLAWVHYLLADQLAQVSPLLPLRMEAEIQTRILTPALEREDFWWMGFTERGVNNWNPWINANWLVSVLLIEADEARRSASVAKIMRSLDRFVMPYPDDGGCDEGPSYWTRAGASLYDCLELLYSASGGEINVYNNPKIQNIGRFVYRAHIAGDYYVNFADAPAIVSPDASLVNGFGQRIRDDAMRAMGAWLGERSKESPRPRDHGHDLTRVLRSITFSQPRDGENIGNLGVWGCSATPNTQIPDFSPPSRPVFRGEMGSDAVELRSREERGYLSAPLLRDVYLPDTQFFAARDQAGRTAGLYLAAKGGHNAESHNHNDVGHFIVYHNGKPLIIDVGVETYTRKTFSPQRYEIWTMQSAYHSLPTIEGIMQAPGKEFAACAVTYRADDESAAFNLDLAQAYPPQAQLLSWKRSVVLQRGQLVNLTDSYELKQAPSSLMLSLMTPCHVELSTPGSILLGEATLANSSLSASGEIAYHPGDFTISLEEISITDNRLGSTWGQQVNRIIFTAINPGRKGQWTIQIRGRE